MVAGRVYTTKKGVVARVRYGVLLPISVVHTQYVLRNGIAAPVSIGMLARSMPATSLASGVLTSDTVTAIAASLVMIEEGNGILHVLC